MISAMLLFFLTVTTIFLTGVVIYQRFAFSKGIQSQLSYMTGKLAEISGTDSGESLMVFTDHPALMELAAQINGLLADCQKTKAHFRKEENSYRKMLANISHDIKTPLTVILGYVEIMRLNGASVEMLEKVEGRAEQVLELTSQFFTLAKLEAGDMALQLCRLDICEVCRENVLEFYDLLTAGNFETELSIPETAVYAQGDKEALQRILYNLISNVLRYGSDGKYLGVFVRQDPSCVYIDVSDKGKGIDQASAERVFDRLFTTGDSRNREVQGNGLGLTIARNLALACGGDILLESGPGKKTTFSVKLKKYSERNL